MLLEVLQASGITAQTSPFPLAIAQIDGAIKVGTKSEFKDALCNVGFGEIFTNHCPFFSLPHSSPTQGLSVILDFLYYIHRPPPPDITIFSEYF